MQAPTRAWQLVLVASASFFLAACPAPTDADDGGVPDAAADVDGGVVLEPPADAGCAGALGCACRDDDGCDRGQCVQGTCTLCTRGALGCLCRDDGSCTDEGARCAGGICEACPPGEVGCACVANVCEDGLDCDDGTCVPSGCPAGALGCPCRLGGATACDDNGTCLPGGLCAFCTADQPGCPCVDGACSNGLVCAATCREPITCEDLVADGFCKPNQACGALPGEDAVCVPGECEEGFVFFDGHCVPGRPNCTDGAPGSILGTCSSLFRQCVQEEGDAFCGDCIGGAQAVDGECVGRLACGDTSCFEDQYCDTTGSAPTCAPLPCPAGEALTSLGECQTCGFSCSGPGLTGRVWPFRSADGSCICETTPGYFMLAGGDTQAELCDQDGDGWIREETRDPGLLIDGALVANARCGVGAVDTVVLRDEHGLDLEVTSCLQGLLINPAPEDCLVKVPMPLVESLRNDLPGTLPVTGATPAYGDRSLTTREVNGIVKACVDGLADFNDNGQADLVEEQAPPTQYAGNANSGEARLESFAYFLETHRAYVETMGFPPRLVIEERRRCHPRDFPLRYDTSVDPLAPTDAYDASDPTLYWRSCQRRVDSAFTGSYDPAAPNPGFDFAQWSCPAGAAGCAPLANAPPYRRDLTEPTPIGQAPPASATLCELGPSRPADRIWRGMHHHSQFKCVRVTNDDVAAGWPASAFGTGGGDLVMNRCTARDCPPGDASCMESRSVVPGSGAVEPVIDCEAVAAPSNGEIGFAAVRYDPYGLGFGGAAYARGCINEDHEFRDRLCPLPADNTGPNWTVNPRTTGFGRQTCFIGDCPEGRADCDGDPLDGCEQDATLNTSCGGCPSDPDAKCFPDNAIGQCDSLGRCQIVECLEDFGDCDEDAQTGCETSLLTLANCGQCEQVCELPDATESCATGTCEIGACALGTANCNQDLDDGCEADVTGTPQGPAIVRCGGCTAEPQHTCAFANASSACVINAAGDNYECVIDECNAGFEDCDGDKSNGCETSVLLDEYNCGACGEDCGFAAVHAVGQCVAGECQVTGCASGSSYGNCDLDDGDDDAFGCEADLNADVSNCGNCNNNCFDAIGDTANPFCNAGSCAVSHCLPGRANCDSQDSNGCEVDLANASCGQAIPVGQQTADSQCGVFCTVDTEKASFYSGSGRGEKFFSARAVDDLGICSEDLKHEVKLEVPSGVDYDLYVYLECGGPPIWKSATVGQDVDETVFITANDGSTSDKSFNYIVEVRWRSGVGCGEWNINFVGRVTC